MYGIVNGLGRLPAWICCKVHADDDLAICRAEPIAVQIPRVVVSHVRTITSMISILDNQFLIVTPNIDGTLAELQLIVQRRIKGERMTRHRRHILMAGSTD